MMTRTCVRDREARKQSSMNVLEKSEPVIKCNAIMIERLGSEDTVITCDPSATMEAILTRDQRTTVHRVFDRSQQPVTVLSLTSVENSSTTSNRRSRPETFRVNLHPVPNTRTNKNDVRTYSKVPSADPCLVTRSSCDRRIPTPRLTIPIFTWLRLGCVLLAFFFVSVNSAPMNLYDRRMQIPPKWVNPCGLAADDFEGDQDVIQLSDETLLSQVVVQAKTALLHAQLFRDDYAAMTMGNFLRFYYNRTFRENAFEFRKKTREKIKRRVIAYRRVKQTFSNDLVNVHSDWRAHHYDWLPSLQEIPKELGEPLDQEYLDKLEIRLLDKMLLNAYEYMQKYAVALEQIAWDQEYYNSKFQKQFKESEFKLGAVLCELQTALIERAVQLNPDVNRDVMSRAYRDMEGETHRNLRDWLIFRDYMNGLEFILQVFDHLHRSLRS